MEKVKRIYVEKKEGFNVEANGVYEDLISGESFSCKNGKIVLPKKEINAYLLKKKG